MESVFLIQILNNNNFANDLVGNRLMIEIKPSRFNAAVKAAFNRRYDKRKPFGIVSYDYACMVAVDDKFFCVELCDTGCCGDVCIKVFMSRKNVRGDIERVCHTVTIVTEKNTGELAKIVSDMLEALAPRLKNGIESKPLNGLFDKGQETTKCKLHPVSKVATYLRPRVRVKDGW